MLRNCILCTHYLRLKNQKRMKVFFFSFKNHVLPIISYSSSWRTVGSITVTETSCCPSCVSAEVPHRWSVLHLLSVIKNGWCRCLFTTDGLQCILRFEGLGCWEDNDHHPLCLCWDLFWPPKVWVFIFHLPSVYCVFNPFIPLSSLSIQLW